MYRDEKARPTDTGQAVAVGFARPSGRFRAWTSYLRRRIVDGVERHRRQSEALLERYRPSIYRHIRKRVRSPEEAEDLTQETLLRAHEHLDLLEDPAALEIWLRRIATNLSSDHLRRAARRPDAAREPDSEEAGGPESRAPEAGLDDLVQSAEMSACGKQLMAEMSPAERKVLLLHDLRGLTSLEIARLLRCTPGAVKIRLHRARRRFKALVDGACELTRDERGVLVAGPKVRPPT